HDRCNAAVGKNRIERCGVPAVTVSDQVGHGGVSVLQVHDQVPGHLGGPGCGGVCGRAEDADAAGGVLDDCENVESRSGQGADFTEVGSEEGVCLAAQEGGPGQVIAVRRRLDAVDLEDLPDGGGATLSPKMASSPWILRYPQLGLSCARRRTRTRMLWTVGRLPGRLGRDALAWRRRSKSRCQRRTVSGETIRWSCRRVGLGILWSKAARNARSGGVSRGLSTRRCRTASWWRSARISMSLSALLIGSNRRSVTMPMRAR